MTKAAMETDPGFRGGLLLSHKPTTNPMKITSITITPMPRPMPEGMFDPMPEVIATFGDGSTKTLFSFYPDEVSLRESRPARSSKPPTTGVIFFQRMQNRTPRIYLRLVISGRGGYISIALVIRLINRGIPKGTFCVQVRASSMP